ADTPINDVVPSNPCTGTIATALNDHNLVVGLMSEGTGFTHAFVWDVSTGRDAVLPSPDNVLPASLGGADDPAAVSDGGTIGGFSFTPGGTRPLVWTCCSLTCIPSSSVV